jgi:hypothetical protein
MSKLGNGPRLLLILGVLLCTGIGIAEATTITFDAPPYNALPYYTPITHSGPTTPNAESVLTNQLAPLGVVFGKAGVSMGVAVVRLASLWPSSPPNSIAGLDAQGILPGDERGILSGDIYFEFVLPGTSIPAYSDGIGLGFTLGDFGGDTDAFQIRCYDLANTLIDTVQASGDSRFSVALTKPGIHRVEVDLAANKYGYSMDDLSFGALRAGGVIPEPVTLVSIAMAVFGLGRYVQRRRLG